MPLKGASRGWKDPWLWGVALAALAFRAIYLADLRHTPFFAHPQMDAAFHDTWARELARGDWWGSAVFFRAPGYPYFLGLLYAMGLGPMGVRVVQILIGTLTVALTVRFMLPRFGRTAAVTAGILLAACGPLIYFEGELLLVVLEAPLFLAALWGWVRAREHPRAAGRWVATGALLGAACLVRPIGLAVWPVLLVEEAVRHRVTGLRRALLAGLGLLLVLSPVLVRNALVGHDLVPVASQGGWNFYLGNHPGADGRAALAPGMRPDWKGGLEDMEFEAERAEGRELKPSAISRYWYGRALAWAADRPGAFVEHQLKKLAYFWDGFELPNNQDYYFFSGMTRLFRWPLVGFGLIGPLALMGLWVGWRRGAFTFPVGAVPLILMSVVVAFFICGRFRASLIPLFAVWAGVGVAGAASWGLHRRWVSLGTALVVLAAAGWLVDGDLHGFRQVHNAAESHFRLGVFFEGQEDPGRAEAEYRKALDIRPDFVDAWNNLGTLYAGSGDLVRARQAFEQALRLQPDHIKTQSNLAALEFQEGDCDRALEHARAVDNRVTYDAVALYNAAVVFGNCGDVESAKRLFARILEKRPDHAQARLGLARAYAALGQPAEARRVLEAMPPEARTPDMNRLLETLASP